MAKSIAVRFAKDDALLHSGAWFVASARLGDLVIVILWLSQAIVCMAELAYLGQM